MEFGIEKYVNNEKWGRRNNGNYSTAKSEALERRKITSTWEYWWWTRKLLKTNLCIKGTIIWGFFLIRYIGPFLQWTRKVLRVMDQRTRKMMTIFKALHPRDDGLYMSRKVRGRGLVSIRYYVDASTESRGAFTEGAFEREKKTYCSCQ